MPIMVSMAEHYTRKRKGDKVTLSKMSLRSGLVIAERLCQIPGKEKGT